MELEENYPDLQEYEWFRPELSRDSAVELLHVEESGAFIIRLSSKPLLLAVSWKTKQGKINHGLIEKTSQGYRFPGEENSTNIISLLSQLEFLNVNWKPKKQIDPYITLKSAKDALEGPGYKEKNNSNNNETTQEQNETKEPSLTKEESKRKRVLSRNKSVMQEIFPEVPEEALTSIVEKSGGSLDKAVSEVLSKEIVNPESKPMHHKIDRTLSQMDCKAYFNTEEDFRSWILDPEKDSNLVKLFLLSMNSVQEPSEILFFLFESYFKSNKEANKRRIFFILDEWLRLFSRDFQDINMKIVFSFWIPLLSKGQDYEKTWAISLQESMYKTIEIKKISLEKVFPLNTHQELFFKEAEKLKKIVEKSSSKHHPFDKIFTKLHPSFVAAQLTICDWELFSNINVHDLNGKWTDKDRSSLFPVRDNFNMMVQWLKTFIVSKKWTKVLLEERVSKILSVSDKLLKLNNFFGASKILFAINSVYFEDLTKIMDLQTKKFYYNLINSLTLETTKSSLNDFNFPTVPSLYHICRYIEMIVDQFPHEEIGYINMKKLKTLCPFYEALIRAQRVSYDIKVNSEFRRMFLSDLYFEGNAMLRKVLSGKSKNMTLSDKFVSGQGAIFSKKKKAEDNIKAISSETLVVPTLSRKLSVSVAAYEYIPIKSKSVATDLFFSENPFSGDATTGIKKEVMDECVNAILQGKINVIFEKVRSGAVPLSVIFSQQGNVLNLFHIAALDDGNEEKSLDLIEFIMESPDSKPDINMRDSYGWTPLHTACNSGSMQVIETLISYGALVNCSNFKGDTPLHYLAKRQVSPTAKYAHLKALLAMLKKVENVNIQNAMGDTALHKCSVIGQTHSVSALLSYNADVNVKNQYGQTPLDLAKQVPFKEIMSSLSFAHSIPFKLRNSLVLYSSDDWWLELGNDNITQKEARFQIETSPYAKHFFEKEHVNIIGRDPIDGGVYISIKPKEKRISVHTTKQSFHSILSQLPSPDDFLKCLEKFSGLNQFEKSTDESSSFSIIDLESKLACFINDITIDLLYIKAGQYSPTSFLKNSQEDHSSIFKRFLSSLESDRIRPGGSSCTMQSYLELEDNSNDFVYFNSSYRKNHRILFRVSSLLSGKNQSFFGTGPVMVVFLESNFLDLSFLKSFKSNILIILEPVNDDILKVTICCKRSINLFPPILGNPSIPIGKILFDFLVQKSIVGSIYGCSIEQKRAIMKARQSVIDQMIKEYKTSSKMSETGKNIYEKEAQLGKGATGVAYKVVHKKTKRLFCMKVIYKDKIQNDDMLERTMKEMFLLKKLNHPYICKGYKEFDDASERCFILELCSGGSLQEDINDEGPYDENRSSMLMYQLLDAVAYMHSQGVSHRDLKPENILFGDSSKTAIKIVDFGFGKDIEKSIMLMTKVGTMDYIAPEILKGEDYDYHKIDVWSCGCIGFFMVYGKPPFQSASVAQLTEAVLGLKINWVFGKISISATGKAFLLRMLAKAKNRDLPKDLLSDPWLTYGRNIEMQRKEERMDLGLTDEGEDQTNNQ